MAGNQLVSIVIEAPHHDWLQQVERLTALGELVDVAEVLARTAGRRRSPIHIDFTHECAFERTC